MSNNKILIIGSIPHHSVERTYGGTTILMQSFIDYCVENKVSHYFIQAKRYLGLFSGLRNYLYVIYHFLKNVNTSQIVMVNAASRGAFFLTPLINVFSNLFKKKFVFRMFGGNFIQLFEGLSKTKRKLFCRFVLSADVLLFETNKTVKYVKDLLPNKSNIFWLPNVRKKPSINKAHTNFNYNFVFISHVKKTKGIYEIIEASRNLTDEYTIDVYGPIMDENITESIFRNTRVHYKGVLSPDKVLSTLSNYDVLLLPTYHPGEGYPGIILEALSMGIPVISTNWNSIPEIITHNKEGILIDPKNADELFKAIKSIDNTNYFALSKNALMKFQGFEEKKVYDNLISTLYK